MAEHGVATISLRMPHRRFRPRAADLPRPWNTTQPSPISATHIGKRLAGKLHEPFERAGGGRAISPTSPDSTAVKPTNNARRLAAELVERRAGAEGKREPAKHAPGAGPGKRPRRWNAYDKPQGKGRRKSSPRFSTISVCRCCEQDSSLSSGMLRPGSMD